MPACGRDIGRPLSRTVAQGAPRPVLEEALHDASGGSMPRGLVERRVPFLAVQTHSVDPAALVPGTQDGQDALPVAVAAGVGQLISLCHFMRVANSPGHTPVPLCDAFEPIAHTDECMTGDHPRRGCRATPRGEVGGSCLHRISPPPVATRPAIPPQLHPYHSVHRWSALSLSTSLLDPVWSLRDQRRGQAVTPRSGCRLRRCRPGPGWSRSRRRRRGEEGHLDERCSQHQILPAARAVGAGKGQGQVWAR